MILTRELVKENNLIDSNGHCIVPDCYTVIGDFAFCNCTNLVSIIIPNSIKKIKRLAFEYCVSLKSIEFDSVEIIGGYAFNNCTSLELVKLPNLKNMGYNAFSGCINLSSINILSNLDIVGNDVFENCTSLPKLGIGKEILEIALKDNYFKQFDGLCSCFRRIIPELMLKYKKPICVNVELPMFTVENAISHANGTDEVYWFENSSNRKRFLEWMLSEIEKSNINDEILILRR